MLVCFGLAAAAAFYGVFSRGPTVLLGVTFPPGSVPVFVFFALLAGVLAFFLALGRERCRKCRAALEPRTLAFAAADAERVKEAAARGDAHRLPPPMNDPALQRVEIALSFCPSCRSVASLEVEYVEQGSSPSADPVPGRRDELLSRQTLSGPGVQAWLALLDRRPST